MSSDEVTINSPLGSWLTPKSWDAGMPPAFRVPKSEDILRMKEQARAEERDKQHKGLAEGNRQKQRDAKARIEAAVELLADRAMACSAARGGDMSFLDKGHTAWKVIDPGPKRLISIRDRSRYKVLARVRAEVQRRLRANRR